MELVSFRLEIERVIGKQSKYIINEINLLIKIRHAYRSMVSKVGLVG